MSDVTLEQAYAVINAHEKARDAERLEASRKLIGRFFKVAFKGEGDEKHARLARVTGVDQSGCPTGHLVQIKVRDGSIYDLYPPFSPPFAGWTEISAQEFRHLTALILEP